MSQSANTVRAAVIGLGRIGREHLKGLKNNPQVEIVAVCDPNQELLEKIANEHGIADQYTDCNQMFDSEKIDIVSVATPNYVHADPTVSALDHGVHVLVEKPMARTYTEGRRMVDAAERNDRVLQVTFNHRYRPDVQVIKQFVDDGGVGNIYHAKSKWLRRHGIPGGSQSWFMKKELAGGGPLIDLGVHMLDMALYILGEPEVEAVSGAIYDKLGQRFSIEKFGPEAVYEVEDFATAFIRLAGGRTLELEASWATYRERGDLLNLVLYGDRGGAEMVSKDYDPSGSVTFYVDAGGVPAEIKPEVPAKDRSLPGHQKVIEQFVNRVQSGDWSEHRGNEGLLRTWIIDAIYQSAADGREIRLSELTADAKPAADAKSTARTERCHEAW